MYKLKKSASTNECAGFENVRFSLDFTNSVYCNRLEYKIEQFDEISDADGFAQALSFFAFRMYIIVSFSIQQIYILLRRCNTTKLASFRIVLEKEPPYIAISFYLNDNIFQSSCFLKNFKRVFFFRLKVVLLL